MPRANRATFRLPASALFVPVLLLFLIIPLATGAPWAAVFYAVPVGAFLWVLITRTTATDTGITTHGLLGNRRMTWVQMDGLEFHGPRWAIAVGTDGRRLRLPMVRPRDLPALAAVSGGSLNLGGTDPLNEEQDGEEASPAAAAADRTADPAPESAVPQDLSDRDESPGAEPTVPASRTV